MLALEGIELKIEVDWNYLIDSSNWVVEGAKHKHISALVLQDNRDRSIKDRFADRNRCSADKK